MLSIKGKVSPPSLVTTKNLQTLWLGLSRTSLKFFLHLNTTAAVQSASLGVLCIDCSIKINNWNFFAGLHFYKS